MKFTGIIKKKLEKKNIKANLIKQDILLEEIADKYPSTMLVSFFNDKLKLIEDKNEWDTITVHLNHKATEYKDNYYNNISAWRVEKEEWAISEQEEDLPF